MTAAIPGCPSPDLRRVLARLVADREFRVGFLVDPAPTLRRAGLQLAPAERDALAESPLDFLDAFETDMPSHAA